MKTEAGKLCTVGEVAKRLGVQDYQVTYVVNSRRIQPVGRAGILRLFDDAAVDRIREALREIGGK